VSTDKLASGHTFKVMFAHKQIGPIPEVLHVQWVDEITSKHYEKTIHLDANEKFTGEVLLIIGDRKNREIRVQLDQRNVTGDSSHVWRIP